MQELAPTQHGTATTTGSTTSAASAPVYMPSAPVANPLHSRTDSTLAPTSEFTRIFLLAWIVRYIFRGASGLAFAEKVQSTTGESAKGLGAIGHWFEKLRSATLNSAGFGGRILKEKFFPNVPLHELEAAAYSGTIGLGSGMLTLRYSQMVRNDMVNIFSEAVGYELGKDPSQVSFDDIVNSKNALVQVTVKNYHEKTSQRLLTDGLFLGAIPFRSMPLNDVLLGTKGIQIFSETWKRKPTLFEDLVTFVNNKINPRNGLGQPVTVGEVFDLYQHYCEQFASDRMFSNVVERDAGESAVWAKSQPIFQRVADLMNLTYAYKHPSILDEQGRTIHQADFPLPKLIYLMGHDLIDTRNPDTTLAYIEVANRYGIEAVKDVQDQLSRGMPLERMLQKYPLDDTSKAANAAPVIETPNSITRVNHADTVQHIPETTIAAPRELLERAALPEHSAQLGTNPV